MPYKLLFESPTTLYCRFSGRVDFADSIKATNEFYGDPRSDQIRLVFWDFSEILSFTVSEDEVAEMAATDDAASSYMTHLKAAFIVRDPELALLTRHYIREMEQYGTPWDNALFETLDEARRWADSP
jgi:hypothetical protein